MKKNIFKDFYFYTVIIISVASFFIGIEYAKYHTDIHHWSFILESYYEYQMGQEFYNDIFLQYGHGLTSILNKINNFYTINFYSLGVVTSFFFSIKFIFIYLICKNSDLSRFSSLFFCILIFSLMTHSQVPWPDVFIGTLLIIFFYLIFINQYKKNFLIILFSSFLLFLTIYLRNTYLLNYLISVLLYLSLSLFYKKLRSAYINKIIFCSFLYLLIFFLSLSLENNLNQWYSQGFGHSANYLGLEEKNLLFNIKKYLFLFSRIGWHLLVPKNIYNLSFTIVFIICLIITWNLLFQKFKNSNQVKLNYLIFLFLFIYGFSGIIQNLNKFEILRYINSSIFLYIIAYIFVYKYLEKKNIYKKIVFLFTLIYIVFINLNFPQSSNFFPVKPKDSANLKDINYEYFGKRKFSEEYLIFYKNMSKDICSKKYIYNLSFDRTFNYLCTNKINKYSLFDTYLPSENIDLENSILISHTKIDQLNLKKKIEIPKFYRYTKSDDFFRFYPQIIYLYEKN